MDRPKSVVGVIRGLAYVLFPFLDLFFPPSTLSLACLLSLCLISLSLSLSLSLSFSVFFSLSLFVWKHSNTASPPSSLRIAGAFYRISSECATPYVSRYVWEWFYSSRFAAFWFLSCFPFSFSFSSFISVCFSLSLLPPPPSFSLPLSLRVKFLLKTDGGYPRDAEVTLFTLAKPGSSLRFNTHWSAPPVSALFLSQKIKLNVY